MKYKIQMIKGKKQWYWRIVHKNGRTLAHSETYSSRGKALQTASNLAKAFRPGLFVLAGIPAIDFSSA